MQKYTSILSFLILAAVLNSCTLPNYALKGQYSDVPFEVKTKSSKEEVWSKIIDLFATKGLAIKVIDKSSGLITSEPVSFKDSHTREDKNGKLIDKNAFVVIGNFKDMFGQGPQVINGDWNIRIKEVNGETVINVNLVNLKCQYITPANRYNSEHILNLPIKSTSVFEKIIADYIK